jgi:hypothetical protein
VRFRALNAGQPLKKEGILVVSNCANSTCCKPLHYLREGRIYIFDASVAASPGQKPERRLDHYWLCGTCAETLMLTQDSQGIIRVLAKLAAIQESNDRVSAIG